MERLHSKKEQRTRRKARIRSVVSGTSERPRLSLFISNKHVSAQIIDDTTHKTIASAATYGKKNTVSNIKSAEEVGQTIAASAKKHKVTKVTFDRNGRKYHGQVKAFADAARENGLEF